MAGSLAKGLLVGLALLAPSGANAARAVGPDMEPAEQVPWTSADGWRGHVRHYPGEGPPVLLVHGMGANHYNWDYRSEVSLAAWLSERGWDVWVPDLRGDPGTAPPDRRAWRNFSFDDHARYDLPAILDAVQAATGEAQVSWVGHSMGGMLLYAALSQYPERIRAGVAIASPARFQAQQPLKRLYAGLGRMAPARGRTRARSMMIALSPLGRWAPGMGRVSNPRNMDGATARGLARRAIVDLRRQTAREVVTWLRAGALTTADGQGSWVTPPAQPVPTLVLAGAGDWLVPASDVVWVCEGRPACEAVVLGESSDQHELYGHIDLVLGQNAAVDVYPLVGDFLAAHVGSSL